MALNPFEDSRQKTRRASRQQGLDVAKVVDVDEAAHMVLIRTMTKTGAEAQTDTSPTPAIVSVDERGDVSLPSVGDTVVVARFKSRNPVVLGTYYTRERDLREYEVGERHIGSDDGSVFIHGRFGVVPKVTEDPTDAPDGAIWYRDDLDEYRGREGGQTVRFDTTAV